MKNQFLERTELSPRLNLQSYADSKVEHSLRQLIEGFILSYKLDGMSPLTISTHLAKLNRFMSYLDQHELPLDVRIITPPMIRAFLGYVRDTYNLSQASVQRHLVSLKAFFRWVLDEELATVNPTDKVKLRIPPKKVTKGLAYEQMQRLYSALVDNSLEEARNKAIVLIFLDCGLRRAELANLKLADIEQDRGIIRIMGKGSKERLVRMGLKTRKALWRYLLFRGSNRSLYLWLNDKGERFTASGVRQMLRRLGNKLGFRLYPHLLRHTYAISFLRNGANAFEVQYSLGHSTLEMTRRYCEALGYEDVFRRHESASPVDNLKC